MGDMIEYVEQFYLQSPHLAFITLSMIKDGLCFLPEINAAFAVTVLMAVVYSVQLGFQMLNIWGNKVL